MDFVLFLNHGNYFFIAIFTRLPGLSKLETELSRYNVYSWIIQGQDPILCIPIVFYILV